jgi:DNA repair exonuclease SbcCD nuclease subunit
MLKLLLIGDPHATPDSLVEMRALVGFIKRVAEETKPDYIVFLGDQFHTHNIIHLEVLAFWRDAFAQLTKIGSVLALVGNHDMSGVKGNTDTALELYPYVKIVNKPFVLDQIGFIGYMPDSKAFVAASTNLNTSVLICHQTFDGSKYENGFYAKDGIDQSLIPHHTIVSGHIHTPQTIGKVWYPGAPRWRTVADANTDRAIWLIGIDGNNLTKIASYDTSTVCKPMYSLKDYPDKPVALPTNAANANIVIDIYGDAIHVANRKATLAPHGRIRTFPTATRTVQARESDGLAVAARKFFTATKPKNGTQPDKLWALAQERIQWLK